jgi:hypothetical protein
MVQMEVQMVLPMEELEGDILKLFQQRAPPCFPFQIPLSLGHHGSPENDDQIVTRSGDHGKACLAERTLYTLPTATRPLSHYPSGSYLPYLRPRFVFLFRFPATTQPGRKSSRTGSRIGLLFEPYVSVNKGEFAIRSCLVANKSFWVRTKLFAAPHRICEYTSSPSSGESDSILYKSCSPARDHFTIWPRLFLYLVEPLFPNSRAVRYAVTALGARTNLN